MTPSFLHGFATLMAASLLGYFGVEPAVAVVPLIAALHAIPFFAKEWASKDLALIATAAGAHALLFSGLAYAVGRGIALTLSA